MPNQIGQRILIALSVLLMATPAYANNLQLLVDRAIQSNPELEVARQRWKMFEQKIVPSEALDDPMLSLTLSNIPFSDPSFDATPISGKELRVSQKFPYPGKLGAKGDMAREQARWYQYVYEDSKLQLAQKIKDAWYRLYFVRRSVDLTENNLALLDDFIRLTESRYAVGQGMQQDVLKAQVERSRLFDRLLQLRQQEVSLVADLNLLVGPDPLAEVQPPAELPPVPFVPAVATLKNGVAQNRPMVTAYRSVIRKFEAQHRLSKLNYYPDFNLFASYRQREEAMGDPVDGSDFFSAGVSMNLPIWQKKRDAGVAEAKFGGQMAKNQLQTLVDKINFQMTDSKSGLDKNEQQIQLLREGLIPQAQQAFEASLSAYQVGKVEFLSLFDSLIKLYSLEIDYHRHLSDAWRSLSRLEAASGQTLSRQ